MLIRIKAVLRGLYDRYKSNLIFKLRLEDIKYDGSNYFLMFRMQLKSTVIRYSLNEAVKKKLYTEINPFDSYCIGILHALSNIEEKYCIDSLVYKLSGHYHFDMDGQLELIECNYLTGTIVLKSKHTNFSKRICIADFIRSAFILYALNAENAYKIGYFITEYLIENKVV